MPKTVLTEDDARALADKAGAGRIWLDNILGSATVESFLFEVVDRTGVKVGAQLVILATGSLAACNMVRLTVDAVSTDGKAQT